MLYGLNDDQFIKCSIIAHKSKIAKLSAAIFSALQYNYVDRAIDLPYLLD